MIKESIKKVVERLDLTREEAHSTMLSIMNGEATPAQIASFITALRMKGETIDEITGCAFAMREKSVHIKVIRKTLVDTCGTGGDGGKTFNISTASALVVAGCELTVAKHGNKAVSSECGSADVLEALGVNIKIEPQKVEQCINTIGIGFMFAPSFHSAMKHAVLPRKEIGIRTVFNILGPLTNPAGASAQVVGVYDGDLTEKLCGVLNNLGVNHAFVVHGEDGLDEISICANTKISELKDSMINTYSFNPEDFGIKKVLLSQINGGTPQQNKEIIKSILDGKKGPHRNIVVLNAAFALVAGDAAKDIKNGIKLAEESIDSGNAKRKLDEIVKFSNEIALNDD
ncbi:anthranilate phosphoribosyltransferase [Candidatus Desantisbacteria bacterium]|nr:anthranilate phosphoribosyltransferase [Candidatus Desantisbacteria bacterium]